MNSAKGPTKRSNERNLSILEQRNYPTSPAQGLHGRTERSLTPRVKPTATGAAIMHDKAQQQANVNKSNHRSANNLPA